MMEQNDFLPENDATICASPDLPASTDLGETPSDLSAADADAPLEHTETPPEITEPQPSPDVNNGNTFETLPQPDFEQLIAEAEHRGYLRGRNDAFSEVMAGPPKFPAAKSSSAGKQSDVELLANHKPSIWDL